MDDIMRCPSLGASTGFPWWLRAAGNWHMRFEGVLGLSPSRARNLFVFWTTRQRLLRSWRAFSAVFLASFVQFREILRGMRTLQLP